MWKTQKKWWAVTEHAGFKNIFPSDLLQRRAECVWGPNKGGEGGGGDVWGGWLQPAWQHAGRALSHTCSLQGPTGASTHCELIRRTPQSTRGDLTGLWPAGSLLVRDPRSRRDELPGRQQGRIIPLALRVQVRTEFPRKPVHKRGI